MRSAVFLPTPGMRVRRATSCVRIARTSSPGSIPDRTASASFGPMPLIEISRSNRSCSSARGEAVERDHVLAHVRVHAQRDAGARLAEAVERRQRHLHVVADAADVDHDTIRMLLERACRSGARSRAVLACQLRQRRRRPRRRRGAARGRWIARGDRAVAAVDVADGDGDARRPRRAATAARRARAAA